MQRRTFLSLLALPAIAQLLQSCGDDSTTPNGDQPLGAVKGSSPRVAAGSTDALAATSSVNAFAADLFDRLVAIDPTANLVFSPASIALALTMTSAGAKDQTLVEMNTVLHITDQATIHREMNGLSAALAAVNKTVDNTAEGGEGTSQVELSIANSLWGQAGYQFEQAFLELLSSEYGAGMELVDYATDPEAARAAINAWVDEQTKQRIPELLPEKIIHVDVRLTLVNAIYLKANWANRFDDALTTDEPFAAPGGEVTAQMMRTTAELGYGEGDGWRAVEIPYVFHDLSFLVAMGADADAAMPSVDEAAGVLAATLVDLGLPRFDIETATSLADVLMEMGMARAFQDRDEFTGMSSSKPGLFIGDVIHQANITVDEEGTEAAAATAVIMAAESAPQELPTPVVFTIDRPFTFWLRDVATGAVVFMGRVNDPSATRG